MSQYTGWASSAPEDVTMEALVTLAYIVKRFGPFTLPPIKEMRDEVAGFGLSKTVIRDADRTPTGCRIEIKEI